MSSSEQAPEPTMDEILASIRKIISDDEAGGEAQPEVAAAEPAAVEPAAPADDGLADELANALADTQETAEAPEVPDDILDLTQVVTEQAPAEAAPEDAAPIAADAQPDMTSAMPEAAEMPEAAVAAEAPAAPDAPAEFDTPEVAQTPEPAETSEAEEGESEIAALLAEAGVQEMGDEAEAAPAALEEAAEAVADAAPAQDDTAVPDPVLVEETSISDALSALDQPAAEEAAPEAAPEDASFDADLVMAAEPEAQAPAEPVEDFAPQAEAAPFDEAVAEVEPEADLGVQMPELGTEEIMVAEAPAEPEAAIIDEPVEAAAALAGALEETELVEDAPAEPEAVVEAAVELEEPEIAAEEPAIEEPAAEEAVVEEVEAAQEADAADDADTATGDVRTLEDSVKELLRPMLREWLDDNMERIVQDEVSSANSKNQDS